MKETKSASIPVIIALVVNVLFALFVLVLASQIVEVDGVEKSRWNHFLDSPPNEIGDTLAGVFGSMTLIWIVASVFQQSIELRAQRHEFAEIAKAQAKQVETMEAQAEIFKDEQARREENRGFGELVQLTINALEDYSELKKNLVWKLNSSTEKEGVVELTNEVKIFRNRNDRDENIEQLRVAVASLKGALSTITERQRTDEILDRPVMPHQLSEFYLCLKRMQEISPKLSGASKMRVERAEIEPLLLLLSSALKNQEIWRTIP